MHLLMPAGIPSLHKSMKYFSKKKKKTPENPKTFSKNPPKRNNAQSIAVYEKCEGQNPEVEIHDLILQNKENLVYNQNVCGTV